MNLRQLALVGLAALALGGTAAMQVGQAESLGQASQVTPPPPPAPNGNVATPGTLIGTPVPTAAPTLAPSAAPSTSPAPAGRHGRRSSGNTPAPEASPSDTPEPPQFSTMDGVWEVQLQPIDGTGKTHYSHLYVTQKGDELNGTWVRGTNDKMAFTGTFDGRLFKLTVTGPKNNTLTLSGYAENFSDMVGLLTTADPKDKGTPFTASHRKKEKIAV
ncbi:MAG: hypothetical protein JO186_00120 [Actinobacteria bacterium]|nr:hypothetical protein [Actinomycetota bacterium]